MRVLLVVLTLGAMTTVGAQSLGDVARQEAARRKTVAASGKTYTNDQLKSDGREAASVPAAPARPTAGGQAAGAASGAKPADGGAAKDGADDTGAKPAAEGAATAAGPAQDEAGWRARVRAAREALSRAEIFAQALQSRVNGLSADFTARDDPQQRAAVAADRQKSMEELDRVKKEIQQHTKALGDLQDEARKAGVPAGWLR